jgi:nitrous oxide reductase accessory protein NosL
MLLLLPLMLGAPASAAETAASEPILPPPKDAVCPVCGMFVAKYPEWIAVVRYKDGHIHYFDGAKDMFKYLLNLAKFAPGHTSEEIQAITVTEYYGLQPIDARQALYVIGSDVVGPMGHELIPLAKRGDAEEFIRDHNGERILAFDEVDNPLLARLGGGDIE